MDLGTQSGILQSWDLNLHLSDLKCHPLFAILCYPKQLCLELGLYKEEENEKKEDGGADILPGEITQDADHCE